MATVIGIDQGNGNLKTAKTHFPCGFTKQQTEPAGVFANEVLFYKNNYYTLSRTKFPYEIDKTKNENCLILTLFGIAKEIKARCEAEGREFTGFIGKDVILALGLPPAHFEKQRKNFISYFENAFRYGVEFTYNNKPFSFHVKKICLYPQDYAAVMVHNAELVQKYKTINCIDIGDGTVELLVLKEGIPQKDTMLSREIGMARLREHIIDCVINDYAYTLDSEVIEDVLTPGVETVLDMDIEDKIMEETKLWAERIVNQLHSKVPDFRTAPTVFCGGGAIMLKPFLEKSGMFGVTKFDLDIHANAIGYEEIAKLENEE